MDIPWNTIYNLSLLTYLIYNYSKYWTIDKIKNLENFLTNNKNNSNNNKNLNIIYQIKVSIRFYKYLKFVNLKPVMEYFSYPFVPLCTF